MLDCRCASRNFSGQGLRGGGCFFWTQSGSFFDLQKEKGKPFERGSFWKFLRSPLIKLYFLYFLVFNSELPFRHIFLKSDKRSFWNICCGFLYWVFVRVLGPINNNCVSGVTISGSRISGLTYNESPGSWNSDLTFRVQAPLLRWVLGLASWVPPLGYRLLGPRSHLWDWSWVLGLGSNRDS